jgi:hypothetical protein
VNLITGSVLLAADATKRLTNPDFFVKMVCVFAGVYLLSTMRKKVFDDPQLDVAPVSGQAKMLAWLSLACWFGASPHRTTPRLHVDLDGSSGRTERRHHEEPFNISRERPDEIP